MVKVSVILPSYNVVRYYPQCIESVINQTLKDIEILCVDAGSTDGTKDLISDYSKRDKRVVLIESDQKSYGYQVNCGLKKAKGEYISIIETDDYIESFMLETLYKTAI